MEAMGLLVLWVLAQSRPLLSAPVIYEVVNDVVTWSKALSYCREYFFDLAIVTNQEQRVLIQDMMANASINMAWIGLHDDQVDAWRWSMYKIYVSTIGESWFTASLNNYGGRLACAYLKQGTLYDDTCTKIYKSVCYDERFQSYILVEDPMTWYDAQTFCRQEYTDLTSIRDELEMDDIVSALDSSEWWVGMFRHTYIWTGNSISPFRAWNPGEPNYSFQRCTAAGANGWVDVSCGESFPFICSVGTRSKVVKVWLQAPASLDLSDPKLLEDLATKMRDLMSSQQAFTVKWRKNVRGEVFSNDPPV